MRFHLYPSVIDELYLILFDLRPSPLFFSRIHCGSDRCRVTLFADIVPSSSSVEPQSQLLILPVFTQGCLHVSGYLRALPPPRTTRFITFTLNNNSPSYSLDLSRTVYDDALVRFTPPFRPTFFKMCLLVTDIHEPIAVKSVIATWCLASCLETACPTSRPR